MVIIFCNGVGYRALQTLTLILLKRGIIDDKKN
jgi:hypothetical protein